MAAFGAGPSARRFRVLVAEDAVFGKPFDVDDLRVALASMLRGRRR